MGKLIDAAALVALIPLHPARVSGGKSSDRVPFKNGWKSKKREGVSND
jgi:hypothetical protein